MRNLSKILISLSLLFLVSCQTDPEAKLHRAAYMGKVDEMETLIDQGMDVNSAINGETPFHRAAKGRRVEAMALLLNKGADIKAKDGKDRDAWDLVWNSNQAFIGDREAQAMAFLLEQGYEGRISLLEAAAKADSAILIKTLVDQGADLTETDEYGWTPLHHAAFHSRAESCLGLLQAGADPNAESTKEFAKVRHGGNGDLLYHYRYEVGSRPLDVYTFGSARSGKSARKVLEEWKATENPNVKNKRKR